MNRLAGILVLSALLAAFIACEEGTPTDSDPGPLAACQDYRCDSLTVRAILDSNGLDSIAVEDVADTAGGRVVALNLTYKNLTSLPPEVGNLVLLREVHVGMNKLTSLPAEIGDLDSLRVLDLGGNNLADLPLSITNLAPSRLNVCGNLLESPTPEVVAWLDEYEPSWRLCQNF